MRIVPSAPPRPHGCPHCPRRVRRIMEEASGGLPRLRRRFARGTADRRAGHEAAPHQARRPSRPAARQAPPCDHRQRGSEPLRLPHDVPPRGRPCDDLGAASETHPQNPTPRYRMEGRVWADPGAGGRRRHAARGRHRRARAVDPQSRRGDLQRPRAGDRSRPLRHGHARSGHSRVAPGRHALPHRFGPLFHPGAATAQPLSVRGAGNGSRVSDASAAAGRTRRHLKPPARRSPAGAGGRRRGRAGVAAADGVTVDVQRSVRPLLDRCAFDLIPLAAERDDPRIEPAGVARKRRGGRHGQYDDDPQHPHGKAAFPAVVATVRPGQHALGRPTPLLASVGTGTIRTIAGVLRSVRNAQHLPHGEHDRNPSRGWGGFG